MSPTGFVEGPHQEYAETLLGEAPSGSPDPEYGIRQLTESIGPIAHMRQVHGDRIAYVDDSGLYEEYDALITDIPHLWLAVKTADCVPILISSPYAVAAIHCGWRGLQQDLLPLTLDILINEFETEPEDIHLTVGPHISTMNYPVSDEFTEYFPPENFIKNNGKWHLNLFSVVKDQAMEMDVISDNIWHANRCTLEDEKLNSHRRSKTNGNPDDTARNISLIRFTR